MGKPGVTLRTVFIFRILYFPAKELSVWNCSALIPHDLSFYNTLKDSVRSHGFWPAMGQAPLSMGFSRQEFWSGLPFPPPGDLPHPGIEPGSLGSLALAGGFFTTSAPWW